MQVVGDEACISVDTTYLNDTLETEYVFSEKTSYDSFSYEVLEGNEYGYDKGYGMFYKENGVYYKQPIDYFFNYSGENCFSVPVGDGIFGTSTYKDEVGFFEYTSHSLSGGSYSIWFITKKEVQYGARHLY
ncbi:MAG: hypothetical protein HRT71_13025 [Flavobacteriales bacterium]|nr:hypothetical protein [Flavobacteriales bacterium]